MGRSKAGIALLIIGLVILIMAPVFKWGIGPALIKVPDTLDTLSVYDGTLTLFVDPSSLTVLPPEMAVKVPLKIERLDKSVPEKGTGSIAVVRETTKAIGPEGRNFIDTVTDFALDRKTSENVTSNLASVRNRRGWYPILPIGAEQKAYPIWSDDTANTGNAEFVRVIRVSGFNVGPTDCYLYKVEGHPAPTIEPPLGLPARLPGSEIKTILGEAGASLNLVDTQEYPITYLKQTDADITGEPRTGAIVDATETSTYYVDASALGQPNIKLATISYKQTPENVKQVLDDASENWGLLDMVHLWIPLILLIVGVVIAAIGLTLMLLKRKAPAA